MKKKKIDITTNLAVYKLSFGNPQTMKKMLNRYFIYMFSASISYTFVRLSKQMLIFVTENIFGIFTFTDWF